MVFTMNLFSHKERSAQSRLGLQVTINVKTKTSVTEILGMIIYLCKSIRIRGLKQTIQR